MQVTKAGAFFSLDARFAFSEFMRVRVLSLDINMLGSTSREGFNANRCYACGQSTASPFASSSPPSGVNYHIEKWW